MKESDCSFDGRREFWKETCGEYRGVTADYATMTRTIQRVSAWFDPTTASDHLRPAEPVVDT
ncbi:hypothetical protein SAMN04487948_107136 [Halogranum amylolyticum]|uniref:Uncharacterized protein n=1 Tax=Halogranum amylolyticum TaxID=660520 RepID=A0A1H8TKR1_9EURY|nr:hypothetical protein SAMN04487948_107136 [Halogranum amylolyticum]